MHAQTHTDQLLIPRAYISYAVISVMCVALALYGFLLVRSVMHVVALRAIEAESSQIERDMHSLEARQVAVIQSLTRDAAERDGFVAVATHGYLANSDQTAMAQR